MNSISMIGAVIITLSLLLYGIGSISLQRFKMVTPGVLLFLTLGLVTDITATAFMIAGSQNSPFSLHGFLGYSALLAMLIDVVLVWRVFFKYKINALISRYIYNYTKISYGWWVIAYLTGSILVIWR